MSHRDAIEPPHPGAGVAPRSRPRTRASYLSESASLSSWLFATDHKRIALLYLGTVSSVFLFGALAAGLLRLELLTPVGDMISADTFNRTFSLHGIAMVWFFLVPAIPAALGTFVLPLSIGARNLAFPRVVRASWFLFVAGVLCLVLAGLRGGVDTGWTFAMPLASSYSQGAVASAAVGVVLGAVASVLLAVTFVVTIHRERAPEMTWSRLPLFVWSLYAASWIVLLSTPFLITALAALLLERAFGFGLFDPALGGDPNLFRQLFWFASRPALYVMALPALGVASEVITAAAGRAVRGARLVAACFGAIAVLGFFTWGLHLSTGGQSPVLSGLSALMGVFIAVPFALVLFHGIATLRGARLTHDASTAWVLGFFGLLVVGGAAGLAMVLLGVEVHLHGTLFVTGHVHLLALGVVMAFLGGLHLWWPKIAGRTVRPHWSRAAALLTFGGALATFGPQIWLGWLGLPRHQWTYPGEFQVLHVLSTAGASLLAVGLLLPLGLFLESLRRSEQVGDDPWDLATGEPDRPVRIAGMEWETTSPPPPENFRSPGTSVR